MMDRRQALKSLAVAGATLGFSGCSVLRHALLGDANLPLEEAPDLSDGNVIGHVVGIRPYRKKKVRLELTESDGRVLIHNYGHGGAGITMGWGSGEVAAEMAAARAAAGETIAVLGSGVVGLSTARALQLRGFRVRVLAAAFPPNTTSNVAGGEWGPAYVALGENTLEQEFFGDVLARSYRHYDACRGGRYGVSRRRIYFDGFGECGLDRVPHGLVPPSRFVNRLPFAGVEREGRIFQTLLIEPPIYLPALLAEVRDAGAVFVERRFGSEDDIRALPERVAVNCMGLGGGEVCRDPLMVPVRGELLHLRPKRLPYLLIHDGYVFPREDAIVIGGSADKGRTDLVPDPAVAQRILEVNRRFFAGRLASG